MTPFELCPDGFACQVNRIPPRTVGQADSQNKREQEAATGGDAFTEARKREAEIRTRPSDVFGDAKTRELDELMAALRALFVDDPNKLAEYYKEIADWLKLTEAELVLRHRVY